MSCDVGSWIKGKPEEEKGVSKGIHLVSKKVKTFILRCLTIAWVKFGCRPSATTVIATF